MKKIVAIVVGLLILSGAGYYYFTLTSRTELNEESPLLNNQDQNAMTQDSSDDRDGVEVDDQTGLEGMDDETLKEFMEQSADMADVVKEMSDDTPAEAELISQGSFKAKLHSVTGNALLIDQGDSKILRFEDFETDNGPKLHIYLSTDLGDGDYIDLGEIKATKGNVNYEINGSINTDKYNKVLIWCKPFGVLFSYAELN